MIKVHNPWREAPSAVRARSTSEVAEKFERCGHPSSDTLNFFVAMLRVVRDVVVALVFSGPHSKQLEHLFPSCQEARLDHGPASWLFSDLTHLPASIEISKVGERLR
jgi:hypothetical protein